MDSLMQKCCDELVGFILQNSPSKRQFSEYKIKMSRKYKLHKIPSNIDVVMHCPEVYVPFVSKLLLTKPVRTLSGVAPVAVMTAPSRCPHGKCAYCPGGMSSHYGDTPQSYTGLEPSAMRAARNDYDAFRIVMNRLEHLVAAGHYPGKVELILQGGTFPALPPKSQHNIVASCFRAMNEFSARFFRGGKLNIKRFRDFFLLPGSVDDPVRASKVRARVKKIKGVPNLDYEQYRNESSHIRCVALAIETRPDYGMVPHSLDMLGLGATRVELGVQTIYDSVLKDVDRGHSVSQSIESTRILKDFGFKVTYHVMLGLPGVTKQMDVECIRSLFANQEFKPDSLKIYPCMVMQGTALFRRWKSGRFNPMSTEQAAEVIAEAKRFIPVWCRVMRVQRDIPSHAVSAGVDRTNLRQYVEAEQKRLGVRCRCIRCREPKEKIPGRVRFGKVVYDASGGKEYFISAEDSSNDMILGFCRLRIPSSFQLPELEQSAVVRELHVYGPSLPFGSSGRVQHRGIGKRLLSEAENIASGLGFRKLAIISGVGAREYYRKLGYRRNGFYMYKIL